MEKNTNEMIKFPAGGMSHEDIGDDLQQKIALPIPSMGGSDDGDLPSIPGVSGYGEGPKVIKPYACHASPGLEGKPGAA